MAVHQASPVGPRPVQSGRPLTAGSVANAYDRVQGSQAALASAVNGGQSGVSESLQAMKDMTAFKTLMDAYVKKEEIVAKAEENTIRSSAPA